MLQPLGTGWFSTFLQNALRRRPDRTEVGHMEGVETLFRPENSICRYSSAEIDGEEAYEGFLSAVANREDMSEEPMERKTDSKNDQVERIHSSAVIMQVQHFSENDGDEKEIFFMEGEKE